MASVQQQQQRASLYVPPQLVPATSHERLLMAPSRTHGTTVCVAAMAARHARVVRQKLAQGSPSLPDARAGGAASVASVRAASPVASSARPASADSRQQFHVKKNLHLQLNMDVVKKLELPLMMTCPAAAVNATATAAAATSSPRQRVQFTDSSANSSAATSAQSQRRRRASSVTLSMNSPEGAEFSDVAHDGPAQLGARTKRVKKLGKGAGGTVYMSIYLPELKLVAVKEVVVYKEDERHMVKHELQALHENLAPIDSSERPARSSPRRAGGIFGSPTAQPPIPSACPYQVAFYGAYLTPARCAVSIVMEFMDMGSLQDLIDAKVSIPEPVVRHAAFCCISALEHMHSRRMIHRDIKPANILLNRRGDFKVADFGLAGTLSKSASYFSEFEGTMMYMAPERITGQNYSYVSDMWSLGVVLFSLATGAYPFAVDDGFFGLEEAICTDPLPPMPNRFSPACRDFLKGLIQRDPATRTTASQALAHAFLRDYEGSAAHGAFESLWQRLPLRPAITPDDAVTIAQVIADHTYRHPSDHIVPESLFRGHSPTSSPLAATRSPRQPPKDSLFGQIADFFGSTRAKHSRDAALDEQASLHHVHQLAGACGVSVDYLERLLRAEGIGAS